jgi:hypothetical protein
MAFIILGVLLTVVGFLFVRRGIKHNAKEFRNGSLALLISGIFMTFLGILLMITGQI